MADDIILYNAAGAAVRLSDVSQVNDRSDTGAGGVHGAWTNGHWYDIYVIYNSGTTTTSTMITGSGTTPKQTTINFTTGIPSGYDYAMRVGSVKHEGGTGADMMWREWYEYGMNKKWVYRKTLPSGIGLPNGFTLTHYLGASPRRIWVRLKVNTAGASVTAWGYSVGDDLRGDDFIADPTDGHADSQPYGIISTSNGLKFWRTRYNYGYESSAPANGHPVAWGSSDVFTDVYIYSEI
jgi:hypothetical protein